MTARSTASIVPDGFALHDRHSPVTNAWQPLYSQTDEESITIGLIVDNRHCNSRGFLHGGVIASLADNAMGLSVHRAALARSQPIEPGALTLGLSVDYISVAKQGTWVEMRCRVHSLGRSIGVVDCLVTDGHDRVIARANATFRFRTSQAQ